MIKKVLTTENKEVQLIHSLVTNLTEYNTSLNKNSDKEYELTISNQDKPIGRLIISNHKRLTYISHSPDNNHIIELISGNTDLKLLASYQVDNNESLIYHWCSKKKSKDDLFQLLTLEMMAKLSITNIYNTKVKKKIGLPI